MFKTELLSAWKPEEWSDESYDSKDYVLVDVPEYFLDYKLTKSLRGKFNLGISKIQRVQNPFVYSRFLLKQEEYKSRNVSFEIMQLFHDTAQSKVSSIVSSNFDWRLTGRVKYGRGVSFAPSAGYANRESTSANGSNRALIVTDVLVGLREHGTEGQTLPVHGVDTTIGNSNNVYVKYFDDEFCPKYVIYYTSVAHGYKPRNRNTAYYNMY